MKRVITCCLSTWLAVTVYYGMKRTTLLALLLVGLAAPAGAQSPSPYSQRALARLAQNVAADQELPDSLRRLTATELLALPESGYVNLLSDSQASDFMQVMAATLHQLPDSLCGRFLQTGQSKPDLAMMFALIDSATVDRWTVIVEQIVRAVAGSQPPGRAASPDEIRAANVAVITAMDAERRQRMGWIAQHPPPSSADACWAMQIILDGMSQLPPPQLGPVVRANFGAPQRSQ